jgi:hypothetical protein
MSEFVVPFPEWTDAFVAAEAEGREVELFASVIGAEVPVRADDECRGVFCGSRGAVPRYVRRWVAWVAFCDRCAASYEAE